MEFITNAIANPDVQKVLILVGALVVGGWMLKMAKDISKKLIIITLALIVFGGFSLTEIMSTGETLLQKGYHAVTGTTQVNRGSVDVDVNAVGETIRVAEDGVNVEVLTTTGEWVDVRTVELKFAADQPVITSNGVEYTLQDDTILTMLDYIQTLKESQGVPGDDGFTGGAEAPIEAPTN